MSVRRLHFHPLYRAPESQDRVTCCLATARRKDFSTALFWFLLGLHLLAIPCAAPVSDRCASREMPEDIERSVRLPRGGPRRVRTQSDQTCGVEVETWSLIG